MKTLVRAHGEPLGTGTIRTTPEDFVVTELYDFTPTGQGEHLLLWIEKRGANTGWVANQLANHFGLRHFDVSYCGKKDRHAVTRQWFSCWLPNGGDATPCEIEGVQILKSTWHSKKLRRGEHAGNHFELTIRDLQVADQSALEKRLAVISQQGVPNYFGSQRFGINGQNYEKACELLNDPEAQSRRKLDRKQKDIYLSALRSWMFNDALTEAVAAGSWTDQDELWVYGLAPHRDIEVPRPGAEYAAAADFIEKLQIKAHRRATRIQPENMQWQISAGTLQVTFSLPVGAYATTVLEELIKIEDGHQ